MKLKVKRYEEEEDKMSNQCKILYEINGLYKAKQQRMKHGRKEKEGRSQM
jgi:hypothetical protein